MPNFANLDFSKSRKQLKMDSTMPVNSETVKAAIQTFYQGGDGHQAAHQFLQYAQTKPEAWSFTWELLDKQFPFEVQFYGALTLYSKISKQWVEVPAEKYTELRDSLVSAVVRFADGPGVVRTKLAVALAALAVHIMPEHWENPVGDFINFLQSPQLESLQPGVRATLLLQLLKVLPEEFNTVTLPNIRKSSVHKELLKHYPTVLGVVHGSMSEAGVSSTVQIAAMQCLNSWAGLTVIVSDELKKLMEMILVQFMGSDDNGLFDAAVECISTILGHPDTVRLPNFVAEALPPVLQVLQKADFTSEDRDMDTIFKLCRLALSVSETHTVELVRWSVLPESDPLRHHSRALLMFIFNCSTISGYYPVDETCSEQVFGFWYMLQDDVVAADRSLHAELLQFFYPLFMQLCQRFVIKVSYPPENVYSTWNAEEKEAFRCYRHDISDTLTYVQNLLQSGLLQMLCQYLHQLHSMSSTQTVPWQSYEAAVYSLSALSENIDPADEVYVPLIVHLLGQIPLTHPELASATAYFLGALGEWLSSHDTQLSQAVTMLLDGLNHPDVKSAASHAIRELAGEAGKGILPHAERILAAIQTHVTQAEMTADSQLSNVGPLLSCAGQLLSYQEPQMALDYLAKVLESRFKALHRCAHEQKTAANKAVTLHVLQSLGWLCWTLDAKMVEIDDEGEEIEQPSERQPHDGPPTLLLMFQQLLPTLEAVTATWYEDAEVIQVICEVYRKALRTLQSDFSPLFLTVAKTVARAYSIAPHNSLLDLSKSLLLLFGNTSEYRETSVELLHSLVSHTLQGLMTSGMSSQWPDTIETFMTLLSQILKKNAELLGLANPDFAVLIDAALESLKMKENYTVKASSQFLVELLRSRQKISGIEEALNIKGQEILEVIVRQITWEANRQCLDHVSDLLCAMLVECPVQTGNWLNQAFSQAFPPELSLRDDDKQHFIRQAVRERNSRMMRQHTRELMMRARGLYVVQQPTAVIDLT